MYLGFYHITSYIISYNKIQSTSTLSVKDKSPAEETDVWISIDGFVRPCERRCVYLLDPHCIRKEISGHIDHIAVLRKVESCWGNQCWRPFCNVFGGEVKVGGHISLDEHVYLY